MVAVADGGTGVGLGVNVLVAGTGDGVSVAVGFIWLTTAKAAAADPARHNTTSPATAPPMSTFRVLPLRGATTGSTAAWPANMVS